MSELHSSHSTSEPDVTRSRAFARTRESDRAGSNLSPERAFVKNSPGTLSEHQRMLGRRGSGCSPERGHHETGPGIYPGAVDGPVTPPAVHAMSELADQARMGGGVRRANWRWYTARPMSSVDSHPGGPLVVITLDD